MPTKSSPTHDRLVHLLNESIDMFFPVAEITAFHEVLELPRPEATRRVAELEGPQEVACLLEIRSDSVDFVNQVLHADDAVLTKMILNDGVVGKRDALLLTGLGIAALVDELSDRLEVRIAVGNERLDNLEHFHGGLGQSHEYTIVDLEQAQELQSLALLRVDLVDTLDAHDERKLGFSGNVVATLLLGDTGEAYFLALGVAVFFDVGFGALEDLFTFLLIFLYYCQHLSSPIAMFE